MSKLEDGGWEEEARRKAQADQARKQYEDDIRAAQQNQQKMLMEKNEAHAAYVARRGVISAFKRNHLEAAVKSDTVMNALTASLLEDSELATLLTLFTTEVTH